MNESAGASNLDAERGKPARGRFGCGLYFLPIVLILAFVTGRAVCYELHEGPILRDGTPAKARVLRFEPTGGSINDDLRVRIDLDVQPLGSEGYQAEVVTYMHPVHFARYQPGALVEVRFDPKEPTDVVLVPP
jgi:hypothetical protein